MNKYFKFLTDAEYRVKTLNDRGFYRNLSDEKFLKKKYKSIFGKKLNLENPKTYNEKLQWLKLYDHNPLYTKLVDKYEVREYIANAIGEEYLIPLLGVWDKFEDIDFDVLPQQFVLKCTHDSGGLVICRDKSKLDIDAVREKINNSLMRNYYWHGREWPYKNVKPRIIAEQYMAVEDCAAPIDESKNSVKKADAVQKEQGLLDYKFMCFNGVVKALFLDIGVVGKGTGHSDEYYRNVYDRDFNLLPVLETRQNYPFEIAKPENYNEMVMIAEKLSESFPHIRIDMYLIDNKIKIGEMTFYHGSGLSNYFMPPEWNDIFGSWIKLPENKY